ncbi:MAG: glycoside hydrolase family 127 protein [Verrucomicrobia bacterium]|nr:glycoside hydrolase family 127 protein [Verrucomicrobiota bacterium]
MKSRFAGQFPTLALALGGSVIVSVSLLAAVELRVPLKAQPFPLQDVRLLDGPFRDAMLRDKAYLLSLDSDRLLHTFRLTAGLPTTAAPYGGWEEPKSELRGHTMGHYLSACALMVASTGDATLKAKADAIVAELAKCQEALPKQGCNKGFLSAYPESFFDRVDAGKPVWAPYYTLHKIMAGLLDMHQLGGNTQALDVLVKMAGWLKFRVDRLSTEQMQKALNNEHGGMNEVLANLYAVTGNPDHLRLAKAFNHRVIFDPLARGEDKLDGLHANTQIPKFIGAAREFELTDEKEFHDIAAFSWERVALHRSYVIGGHSDREHFFPTNAFARHLGAETCETCNTYNMLKLTRHLFAWEPSARTMDFYERALWNHILGSQDPKTGMFNYFPPLKPGHFKAYSTPTNSFWCCVGTGMENHAKYGDAIYFHDDDSLYVNQFIASDVKWAEHNLVVRQETKFPSENSTRLTVKCEAPLKGTMRIRHPSWATSLAISVNGKKEDVASAPGSYATIQREWKNGDVMEVRFPMTLRTEELPGESSLIAFLYGPIVLAGELGAKDLPNLYLHRQTDLSQFPAPEVPVLVCDAGEVLKHVEPVAGQPLRFRTKDLGRPQDVSLIPFYEMHHQRYSVYWKRLSEADWQKRKAEMAALDAQRRAYETRTVDIVQPGEQQPEIDHSQKGVHTQSGNFQERKWRDANQGGWFSYEVKVLPGQPMTLVCTYWGGDTGAREFDILVDGEKIATQKLDKNKPGDFFDASYPLPERLTRGRERVIVKFQAHPEKMAGGLFGLRIMK